jgi:hypothetical protein
MTTATTIATTDAILALDLGKYKSVACIYDPADGAVLFQTLPTSRRELRRLLDGRRPAVVVIEACTLAGWVHELSAFAANAAPHGLTPKAESTHSQPFAFFASFLGISTAPASLRFSLVRERTFGVRSQPYGSHSDPERLYGKLSDSPRESAKRVDSGSRSDLGCALEPLEASGLIGCRCRSANRSAPSVPGTQGDG